MSGGVGQIGIKRWGEKLSVEALQSLGITRGRVPAPSVWCEFFKKLDVGALEQVLAAWVTGDQGPPSPCRVADQQTQNLGQGRPGFDLDHAGLAVEPEKSVKATGSDQPAAAVQTGIAVGAPRP